MIALSILEMGWGHAGRASVRASITQLESSTRAIVQQSAPSKYVATEQYLIPKSSKVQIEHQYIGNNQIEFGVP